MLRRLSMFGRREREGPSTSGDTEPKQILISDMVLEKDSREVELMVTAAKTTGVRCELMRHSSSHGGSKLTFGDGVTISEDQIRIRVLTSDQGKVEVFHEALGKLRAESLKTNN